MSKVVVTADKKGNVIIVSENNPEYGVVRVEQTATEINGQGWLRNVRRTAFIKGKVDDLVEMDFEDGQELPGKIVVKESLVPFNSEEPDRDLKIAGDTGIICRLDDQPIYRQTFYTPNKDAEDTLVMHNNSEEIRDVIRAHKELRSFQDLKIEVSKSSMDVDL
jgi:hypothetical protein